MSFEHLLALLGFAFVSSITPGPNNMMLLASGANFGVRRTLPHMFGISIGHSLMVVLVGLGLITLFDRFPVLHQVLTVVSVAYLLWLAWKIGTAGEPQARSRSKPFSFVQAAAFQWVNPKAWYMALTAITVYAPGQTIPAVLSVAAVFACTNLPAITFWVVLGQQMRRFLTSPLRLRVFNWTMAALLVLSLAPLIWH